ncbi:TauD/TfdA family dioxygenase [Chryseosolibacter indicus]|uniref:TauD/TfdA family dioxygenase n=1 Tax=Chryseosolibacter indicus TaxID=2782351 RepID=A0ABS5VV16_9BACT|nr:TauD/TfdA family dioxygenase [Chryseosolibacter indicus]MBT1705273.1 TauD/TfdA family dioxygenase [Chryseosolibacter indicus]
MWIYENIDEIDAEQLLLKYGHRDKNNYGEAEIIYPGKPSKAKMSLTSKYGMGEFPFHTDVAYWPMPAKYLAFYCLNPGQGGRVTRIINLESKLDEFAKVIGQKSDLFVIKKRAKPFYTKLINGSKHDRWIRWDQEIMSPVIEPKISSRINEYISQQEAFNIHWKPDMLVIIDNRRMLHARGNSDVIDSDRILKRIFIN